MTPKVLSIGALSCHIGTKTLLSEVTVELASGEFLVVIGRNGAGKSTLLKHATGEMKSPHGSVAMFGQPLHAHAPRELAQRRAVLAQSTPLNFEYQVLEVVLLGRIPH